jgi:tape measure domain-containing protein
MNLAELAVTIRADGADQTVSDIQEVGAAITQTAGKVNVMSGAMAGLGMAASITAAIVAGFVAVGKAAVNAALPLDSFRRGLAALSKDVDDYQKQIKRLTDLSKAPGLGLQEVFAGATQLQGAGISSDTTAKMVKELGNAVAMAGRGRNEFKLGIDQLGKMAGLGKVTMEDLNQIAAYAPTVRNAFSRALGTLDSEKIAKMGLSMEEIFKRVGKELEKDARATASFQTELDNLADSFQVAMEPLGSMLLTVWTDQSRYAQTFFDDLQMVNEELGLMAMRMAAIVPVMQSAFGGPMVTLIRGFNDATLQTVTLFYTMAENVGIYFKNAVSAFGYATEKMKSIFTGNRVVEPKYEKPTSFEDNIKIARTVSNVIDAVNIARMARVVVGGPPKPPAPPTDPDKDKKEQKDHLKRIEANTRKAADALTFNRQIFGGRQLGQLGVTAVELNQGNNRFRGTSVIPGSTLINRGLQQIINQSQRNYLSTPLARY